MLEIRWNLLLVHTASFLVAMVLIWQLFLKPLLAAMNKRSESARSDLDGARKAREEAERLQAKLDKEFVAAREKVKQELEKAAAEGEAARKQARAKAQAEAEAMLEKARREIADETDRARKVLRGEAAGLAVAITERLLEAEVDAKKHKKLIDEMVGKV